jgi:pyruvate carboxylase
VPTGTAPPDGTRHLLETHGAARRGRLDEGADRVLITDTTMRDGHQSLLATRMRSIDMIKVAPAYAANLPQLFSVECWGGATFDVAYRFLQECPWQRLRDLRAAMPNIMTQMLLRGSNGVGYTNYPDNVVQFLRQAGAETGVDVFRVFDSLNWVENMRVSMDAVLETGKRLRGRDLLHRRYPRSRPGEIRPQILCRYGQGAEAAGAHVLG